MIETGIEFKKDLFHYKTKFSTFYFDKQHYAKIALNSKNCIPITNYKYLGKKILSNNKTSIIKNANKIWDIGWYIELVVDDERIPWKNISSINPSILDSIEVSHLKFKIKK